MDLIDKFGSSEFGMKETAEAMIGVNELGLLMINRFRDGVQLGDFNAFWDKFRNDEEFKAKLHAAWEGYNLIPDEMRAAQIRGTVSLMHIQLDYVPAFFEAFAAPIPDALPAPVDSDVTESEEA